MYRFNPFNTKKYKPEIKVILLGDSGVGKTTIFNNLLDLPQKETTSTTLTDTLTYSHNPNFDIHYYDTAGQERFNALTSSYFRQVDIALLVFTSNDVKTSRSIFNNWFQKVKELNPDTPIKYFLIANKIDLLTTKLDQERLNDPHLSALNNDMDFITLSNHDPSSYLKLKAQILHSSQKILETRKENLKLTTPTIFDYVSPGYWLNRNKDQIQEEEESEKPFDELFKSFYGENWKEEFDKENNCCQG